MLNIQFVWKDQFAEDVFFNFKFLNFYFYVLCFILIWNFTNWNKEELKIFILNNSNELYSIINSNYLNNQPSQNNKEKDKQYLKWKEKSNVCLSDLKTMATVDKERWLQ